MGDWPLMRDSAILTLMIFFFQQYLDLCVKCTAPQNKKVVIQVLLCISSLVTLTAQSMIIISNTASHGLQAAPEKVKLGLTLSGIAARCEREWGVQREIGFWISALSCVILSDVC